MRRSFRSIAIAIAMLLLLCVVAQPRPAPAIVVFDPVNFAKNALTELHTLQVTINQATQIANEFQQLAYEVQNLRNIPSGVWGEVRGDLAALKNVVKSGASISYADERLSDEFAALYPGYAVASDEAAAYQHWASNTLGGMRGALAAAGVQSAQLADEDGVLVRLQSLSDGASGRMEALQVGNMIAVQQVQQLQKLRQLQMAQMQGELSYFATQQQNDAAKYATLKAWLSTQDGYHSHE